MIFHFVSFSYGIFSHFLIRSNNEWYLRETEEVTTEKGEECSWLYHHNWGTFSWGGQRYHETWAGEKGLGAAPSPPVLLAFRGERGCSCCGQNSPPLRGSVSCCLSLPWVVCYEQICRLTLLINGYHVCWFLNVNHQAECVNSVNYQYC